MENVRWHLLPISLFEFRRIFLKIFIKCTPEAMFKILEMRPLFVANSLVTSRWLSMIRYVRRRLRRKFSVRSTSFLAI